jgi:hypothetical protein
MSRSNQSSPKRLGMIERDRMQLLDHSLQLSKAMIRKLEQRQVEDKCSTQSSTPPALLYRFQMGGNRTKSPSPKGSRSTSQLMHGSLVDKINVLCYETPSPRHSSLSKSTLSIPKLPSDLSLTNQTVQNFQIRNGKTSSLEELSTSMPSSVDNSPPPMTIQKSRSSVILRSPLEQSSPLSWSRVEVTGSLPGIKLLERLSLPSPTGCKNLSVTYGEYIVNLFSVTHSSVHSRVVAFNRAVRKRIGSVRNLELWDFEKFADLKIAHMDSIGVSVISGSSKDNSG